MGEIFIFILGDSFQINRAVEAQLIRAGLTISHVPGGGGNDAADRKMIVQMLLWSSVNPSPANILLISGDVDFWHTLEELKYLSCKIILAHQRPNPMKDPPTDIIWEWSSLLSGDLRQPILPCQLQNLFDKHITNYISFLEWSLLSTTITLKRLGLRQLSCQ